jgi:penicillin-binding protein 1A
MAGLLAIGLGAAFLVCVIYGVWAYTFDMRDVEIIAERSAIYDMDGRYYSRLAGENRIVVPLEKISPHFQNALLAREDTRFYRHRGIDPVGILRALVRNVSHGRIREGGSTLTQQLALNTFLGGRHVRSLHRKVLEAFLAARIEQNFTKKEILEHYANRIYFGSGYYGVETASQAYFAKPAASLSVSESAMLVGLIRSPNRFSPFNNFKGALRQRDAVLGRMADLKMITKAEAAAAEKTRPAVARKRLSVPQENYAMDALRRELDLLLDDEQLDEGGLKIYTTIDPVLQKAAQAAVDTQIRAIEAKPGYAHPRRSEAGAKKEADDDDPATNYLQGALVAIDNRTGGIRALVGGRDYIESRFNRALLSRRQVGSTFKPFVYAAAFGRGLSPEAPVDDGPIQPGELRNAGNWSPGNSDGAYKGRMPSAEGLIQSRNTMSARVGNYAGLDEVRRIAAACGFHEVPRVASIYLGAFESTLKELTAAYTVFPNEGVRKQPYLIERIDDMAGNVLYRAAHVNAAAVSPAIAGTINAVLSDVLDHGTAASARTRLNFNKPAAGKTGTTNDFFDAWFVGYTKSLTCGVWVGLDKPATIISRGYGAALALPIWTETMNAASVERYPVAPFGGLERSAPRRTRDRERDIRTVPRDIFRSFRKFFGG